jgi:hypothetical protein
VQWQALPTKGNTATAAHTYIRGVKPHWSKPQWGNIGTFRKWEAAHGVEVVDVMLGYTSSDELSKWLLAGKCTNMQGAQIGCVIGSEQ